MDEFVWQQWLRIRRTTSKAWGLEPAAPAPMPVTLPAPSWVPAPVLAWAW
jgi:hypothetical protein